MSVITENLYSVNDGALPVKKPRIAWGAEKISTWIDRTPRQTWHMLSRGEILCAKKKGRLWFANVEALLREFGEG